MMAQGIPFPGANKVFTAPKGRADISDLHVFANGKAIVSAHFLSEAELVEIVRTRTVFLSVLSGNSLYPVFVGSEETVRRVVADYGAVWFRPPVSGEPPVEDDVPTCTCSYLDFAMSVATPGCPVHAPGRTS